MTTSNGIRRVGSNRRGACIANRNYIFVGELLLVTLAADERIAVISVVKRLAGKLWVVIEPMRLDAVVREVPAASSNVMVNTPTALVKQVVQRFIRREAPPDD